jgi:excisionase family DNA binding protein
MYTDWLSTREVAEHFGVTPVAVFYWIHSGKLPAVMVGGRWKVKPSNLGHVVRSNQLEPEYPTTAA